MTNTPAYRILPLRFRGGIVTTPFNSVGKLVLPPHRRATAAPPRFPEALRLPLESKRGRSSQEAVQRGRLVGMGSHVLFGHQTGTFGLNLNNLNIRTGLGTNWRGFPVRGPMDSPGLLRYPSGHP